MVLNLVVQPALNKIKLNQPWKILGLQNQNRCGTYVGKMVDPMTALSMNSLDLAVTGVANLYISSPAWLQAMMIKEWMLVATSAKRDGYIKDRRTDGPNQILWNDMSYEGSFVNESYGNTFFLDWSAINLKPICRNQYYFRKRWLPTPSVLNEGLGIWGGGLGDQPVWRHSFWLGSP